MIANSLLKKEQENKTITYEVGGQQVKLSPQIIKNYLVNGGGNVSDQEVVMFLNLCRYQKLNPFLREAYLIKYGSQPATMVTGKDAIIKRATRNDKYAGSVAGIIVINADGEIERRTGTFHLKNEELVGGWAEVFVKGYEQPIENEVSLDEYIGVKSTGEINSQWSKKPATMIRKVALVQALREAFPEDLQGMYEAEEMNVDMNLDTAPIEQPTEAVVEEVKPEKTEPKEEDKLTDEFFAGTES